MKSKQKTALMPDSSVAHTLYEQQQPVSAEQGSHQTDKTENR
jgi:hypothetical protein